ncbi:hypothetical protein MY04_5237 [Flammeovirga sp. MY04]|uniref:hypothetical protein n=1 Tax=Flammeovirga sp. MY04 TaxID=1191459 RepID=UPI0008257793|nr:hypothetical protein [Flammeovirga sp. MY04]ANQ52569.2 hypothetical protein MY04_5237 [Flammeovirga sp. MY04]
MLRQFVIFSLLLMIGAPSFSQEVPPLYPYWGEYNKTPLIEVQTPLWKAEDHVIDGWDWSFPNHIKAMPKGLICVNRIFNPLKQRKKIDQLPNAWEYQFPITPVVSHWVQWHHVEAEEGKYDFSVLKENIELCAEKGYGSIVRLHSSAIDFAPDWIKKYNIPIRTEHKKNPMKTNYDVSHPEFHKRYLALIQALGDSGIPHMNDVKGLFVGYASPSNGDEGIGPHNQNPDTVQHVIERLDQWAKITKGVEEKVFMGGVSQYGLKKGFGIRRGFVEMYLYKIPSAEIGQKVNKEGYLIVDEENEIIKNNSFHGEENEEYETVWATSKRGYRFGHSTDSFPYRYFSSNLRLLQMRCSYVLFNEFTLNPEMFAWVSASLGRTVNDAFEGWSVLRESRLKNHYVPNKKVKNFERWVYQRDSKGYETTPVIKMKQPVKTWYVDEGDDYDYIGRKGNKIGFKVDEKLKKEHKKWVIKVSYFDNGNGTFSLKYGENKKDISNPVSVSNTGKIKTATFVIWNGIGKSSENFDLEIIGDNDFAPEVSMLRAIKY